MKFKTEEEYRNWLSSDDRLTQIRYLDINTRYYVSSKGYVLDGIVRLYPNYFSTNGNEYILLETDNGSKKYFQFDKIIAYAFYVENQDVIPHDRFRVIHINENI